MATININMRCIEMCVELQHCGYATEININMRCIEILTLILKQHKEFD